MQLSTNCSASAPLAGGRVQRVDFRGTPGPRSSENSLIYRIQVAGKLFQGTDPRALLKLAVAAKRAVRGA